jgi:hypothetical protein
MTSQEAFLQELVQKMNEHDIPYMITGSISSSLHGCPRATQDIDIVIAPTEKQLKSFVESLGSDYYVSIDAVRNAFVHNLMFNIIDNKYSLKADFIIRKKRPFSILEFERRCLSKIKDSEVWVTSPEDTILCKLEWAKDSRSEKQFSDVLGVILVHWENIDRNYLLKWARELNVEDSLEQLLKQAETIIKFHPDK